MVNRTKHTSSGGEFVFVSCCCCEVDGCVAHVQLSATISELNDAKTNLIVLRDAEARASKLSETVASLEVRLCGSDGVVDGVCEVLCVLLCRRSCEPVMLLHCHNCNR